MRKTPTNTMRIAGVCARKLCTKQKYKLKEMEKRGLRSKKNHPGNTTNNKKSSWFPASNNIFFPQFTVAYTGCLGLENKN